MEKRFVAIALGIVTAVLGASPSNPNPASDNSKPSPSDIPAARVIADPYPTFNGIAVDPANNLVGISDPNRKSLLLYDRAQRGSLTAASVPLRQIIGPETYLGMIAGILLDPQHHEIYTANNDIEDTVVVMPYGAAGNAQPVRVFSVPHQTWGIALGARSDELAVTVEVQNAVVFYRREVKGVEAPMRIIRGPNTGLADPHGLYWDETHKEIAVANHGNFRGLASNDGAGCTAVAEVDPTAEAGKFEPPSIRIFAADAKGDTAPLSSIQGPRTRLDWPMGIAVDPVHNTIVVANNGDNSVLIFARKRRGDVAPVRVIKGGRTGITHPMGVAVDPVHGEIWVANYGDHTALAFDSVADGDVAPRRVIRGAPAGSPTPGFGNPMALAYDSKRQQLLVPN